MGDLMVFTKPEFGDIRTLMLNGEPHFVGKDVALALGYQDTDQAIRRQVDDEDKLTRQIDGSGQRRDMVIINESGLYSLIMGSQLPAAKQFKRWVTSEVLPSIRKTGGYNADQVPTPAEALEAARLLVQAKRTGQTADVAAVLQQGGFNLLDISRPAHGPGSRGLKGQLDPNLVRAVHEFLDYLLPQIQNWSLLPFMPLRQLFDSWLDNQGLSFEFGQAAFIAALDEILPLYGWAMPRRGQDGKYQKVWSNGRMDGQELMLVKVVPAAHAKAYRGIIRD